MSTYVEPLTGSLGAYRLAQSEAEKKVFFPKFLLLVLLDHTSICERSHFRWYSFIYIPLYHDIHGAVPAGRVRAARAVSQRLSTPEVR